MSVEHYSVENYQLEDSIGFLVQQVKNVLGSSLDKELAGLGISWAQWKVLMRVHYGVAKTAADLCRCIETDTGSMTRMVDRLEEKGFLRRARDEADRRIVNLYLTEAGLALVPAMLDAVVKILNFHLRDFTAEEVVLLKSMLRRIVASANECPGREA